MENKGRCANHVVYADQRLVERRSKCLGSAGTNPKAASHTYGRTYSKVVSKTHSPATTESTYLVHA
jgi:hypothetical protein